MTEILAAVIGALVGAILTFLYTKKEYDRQMKIHTTLSLYEEFQSTDMMGHRLIADAILKENRDKTKLSFSQLHQSTVEFDKWHATSRVVHYFEKASILYREKYLDRKLANKLLGRYFQYYYIEYLQELAKLSEDNDPYKSYGWYHPIRDVCSIFKPE